MMDGRAACPLPRRTWYYYSLDGVTLRELLLDGADRPLLVGELDVEAEVAEGGPRRLLGLGVRRQRRPQQRLHVGRQEVGAQLAAAAHHVADRVRRRRLRRKFNRGDQL